MTAQKGLALLFTYGVLLALSDFDSTGKLATALALVIMATILFQYGEAAVANVRTLVGAPTTQTNASTGGGGGLSAPKAL